MAKSNLFSRIRTAGSALLEQLDDVALVELAQKGNTDAIAVYAKRHANDLGFLTDKRKWYNPDNDEGQMWLDLYEAMQNYKAGRGAQPRTFINENVKQQELNRYAKAHNRNQIAGEVNVDDYGGANNSSNPHADTEGKNVSYDLITGANAQDNFEKQQRQVEMEDVLQKIMSETDDSGRELINSYKKADYNNAGLEHERFNRMLESGQDAEAQLRYRGEKNLGDADVARDLGTNQANVAYKRKTMLDRLSPRLKAEALEIIRRTRGR